MLFWIGRNSEGFTPRAFYTKIRVFFVTAFRKRYLGEAISGGLRLLSVIQAATNTASLEPEPSISQRSQIKEDTVEPSVPAREFNLKAYTPL